MIYKQPSFLFFVKSRKWNSCYHATGSGFEFLKEMLQSIELEKGKVRNMAMYDWNNDGKIDIQDDYRECQMYQTSIRMQKRKREKNGISTSTNSSDSAGIAVFCTIGGMLFAGF